MFKVGDRVIIACIHDAGDDCELQGKTGIVSDIRIKDCIGVRRIDNQTLVYITTKWLKIEGETQKVNPQLTFVFKE